MEVNHKSLKSQYRSQRTRNLFTGIDIKPYRLSRSKIENYMRCKRCFYFDRKCGTEQPPMYPYTLNNAVDALLKNEFNQYRFLNQVHPYLVKHGIDAIPFSHEKLNDWRMNQRGLQYYHEITNFMVMGAIDDVWINFEGELIVVDYKATSTQKEVSLDDRDSYKRQMEIYQWLLRKNGFKVSNTAYFVYCNGDSAADEFDGMLKFKISLLPYHGDDTWIEQVLIDIKQCLIADIIPDASIDCNYCNYWFAIDLHVYQIEQQRKMLIKLKRRVKFKK